VIWFAWRQFRTQAIVAAGILAALAIVFGITGLHLHHQYDTVVKHCASHADCGSVTSAFQSSDHLLQHFVQAGGILLPALLGAFWGAPLVAREFESGTFRLAWTQSVSRTTWLMGKFAVVALAAVVTERALYRHGNLVGDTLRSPEQLAFQWVRCSRHRAHWVRALRGHARRSDRSSDATHGGSDGPHVLLVRRRTNSLYGLRPASFRDSPAIRDCLHRAVPEFQWGRPFGNHERWPGCKRVDSHRHHL
jgi:hypothetical protein